MRAAVCLATSPWNWNAWSTKGEGEGESKCEGGGGKAKERVNRSAKKEGTKGKKGRTDLHVARLESAVGGGTKGLLDLRLVEVGFDPLHLLVAERTVLAIAVALHADLHGEGRS
jgi:hypothetical protein